MFRGPVQGTPLWLQDDVQKVIWEDPSVAPGGCSARALLPCPVLHVPFPGWLEMPVTSATGAKGCHKEMPVPGSAWVTCGALGSLPLEQGPGVPTDAPRPPPPETVVCNVCASRGSAEQPSSAYSVALGQPCSVLVRVVSPPTPPRCASCFPLPESGALACLRALGLGCR